MTSARHDSFRASRASRSPRRCQGFDRQLVRLLHALGKKKPLVAVCVAQPARWRKRAARQRGDDRHSARGAPRRSRSRGRAHLVAPVGAETAYRLAHAGQFATASSPCTIDQATIPLKLVAFGDTVNITVGLSIVRTSVDHGTAYDIAWTGKADPGGMVAAMRTRPADVQKADRPLSG